MNKPVFLREVVEAVEFMKEDADAYYEQETGKIIIVTENDLYEADLDTPLEEVPEERRANVRIAKRMRAGDISGLISLPCKRDLNERNILGQFCNSIKDKSTSEELAKVLNAPGAFRKFRDVIHRTGLVKSWEKFRGERISVLARKWCAENEIPVIE